MNIIVCIKRVADTSEAEIVIQRGGQGLEEEDFAWGINEWDNFAVEAAVQLKEQHGGVVTAMTLGGEDDEEVLRRALAMGCDEAVHLCDEAFAGADAWGIAKALAAAVRGRSYDLLLCGAVSGDAGGGQVGGFLAGLLDLPLVALATCLEVGSGNGGTGGVARVRHEVESGLERVVEVDLPAVVTVQTGINEPRYVSIRGIRKVAGAEVQVLDGAALGLQAAELGSAGARVRLEELFLPPRGEGAEVLEGSDEEIVQRLVEMLHQRGGL